MKVAIGETSDFHDTDNGNCIENETAYALKTPNVVFMTVMWVSEVNVGPQCLFSGGTFSLS